MRYTIAFASSPARFQRGAVLVTTLVILVLMSILGLSAMETTALEQRMAGNTRDQHRAFHAAESALRAGERFLEANTLTLADVQGATGCTNCFSSACSKGLCFMGSFPKGSTKWMECVPDPIRAEDFADETSDYWDKTAWHRELAVDLHSLATRPVYVIEFLCYTKADPDAPDPDATADISSEFAAMYRITALAKGTTTQARVLLQSTYKKLL